MSCEESFRAALGESGIEFSGPIYIDGKLHRIKANGDHSKNSWYVVYPGSPAAGAYGCWKRDLKGTWCERNGSLTQPEWHNVRQRWQEASAKLNADIIARQKKARKVAAWILNRSRPALTLHRYLFQKRIKVFGNLRWYRRSLVLPLCDLGGELQSLQFIGDDGAKKFLSGGRITGCFFTLADKADGPLVICEGYATGASIYEATGHSVICAMNSGNLLEVAKAARELWPEREIIIAADNDQFTDSNPGLTKATTAAREIRAKLAVSRFQDTSTKPTDFNDLAIAEGLDAVRDQISAAQIPTETDADAIARLAALPVLEYERCRKEEAEKLGCREPVLDKLVEERRPKNRESNSLQGNAVQLPDVEPWPEPVNGAELLNEIAEIFTRHVVLPDGAADVCSLWCALTHVFDTFLCSPRLNVRSAEPECGKTTLRDVIALFVPRPILTENLTVAVLFRLVNAQKPVILADEYDAWMSDNEEMRGLLNAGHRRGAMVYRCEGDGNEVRAFSAYAPATLCGIGALPGTLHDRSIVIHLERKRDGEVCFPFDSEKTARERDVCRKLARWCADNRERFAAANPKLPAGVFNRLADNWRPLFAIAEAAGGDWPRRCADACAKLTRRDYEDAESIRTILLVDIRKILAGEWPLLGESEEQIQVERIFSKTLVGQLCTMTDRPWPEARRGKPISEQWLAKQLANFGIYPKTLRIGEERAKGYESDQFANAFARYLRLEGDSSRDAVTYEGKRVFRPVTKNENVTAEKKVGTEGNVTCHASKEGVSENGVPEAVSDELDAMPEGILEL